MLCCLLYCAVVVLIVYCTVLCCGCSLLLFCHYTSVRHCVVQFLQFWTLHFTPQFLSFWFCFFSLTTCLLFFFASSRFEVFLFGLFLCHSHLGALFCCMFWLSWTSVVNRPMSAISIMSPRGGDMTLSQWLLGLYPSSQRSTDLMINTPSFHFIILYICRCTN